MGLFGWVGVADAVPIPSIQMSAEHSNLSAEVCNVNCSIQDDWVVALCDGESCRTSQSSLRRVNISISADNSSVVCRANNDVSTNSVTKRIDRECKWNRTISTCRSGVLRPLVAALQNRSFFVVILKIHCVKMFLLVFPGFTSQKYNNGMAEVSLNTVTTIITVALVCVLIGVIRPVWTFYRRRVR